MNPPVDTPGPHGPVRYMLGFEGPAERITRLRALIADPLKPGVANLGGAFEPPSGFLPVDAYALPHYLLVQADWSAAAAAFHDLGEEPELAALLQDPLREAEAREALRTHVGTRLDAAGVAAIRHNIREFGARTANAWRRKAMGGLHQGLGPATWHQPEDTMLTCLFSAAAFDDGVAERLSESHESLAIGQIVVDQRARRQAYSWFPSALEPDESGSQSLTEAEFDYLRLPPPCLAHFLT